MFALLAGTSVVGGLAIQAGRRDGLALRYVSPEARVQRVVADLAGAEPGAAPVEKIGLEAVRGLVSDRSAILLDARPGAFYRAGHIPGALNLSRATFAADYARLRPRLQAGSGQQIVVYCADADCPDSGMVAAALAQLGSGRVMEFEAGWAGWTGAGLPREGAVGP